MTLNETEVARRKNEALLAIKRTYGTEDGELSSTLFVSHHLEELDASYWQKHLGTKEPNAEQVLDILVLRSHWGDDDSEGIDVFDFTLPDDVTNYVMCVRFDEHGHIWDIAMES